MKKLIFLFCFLVPGICNADEPSWEQIKKLEITYQTLNIIDIAETMYFLHNNSAIELNPILGKDPSPAKVVGYKTLTGILHYYAAEKLYEYNPRYAKNFEYVTIGVQGAVVALNLRFFF
jgi:hypothetical protein